MKVLWVILPMLAALTLLTYCNMWQMKYIDTGGKLINKDLLTFLAVYGLLIVFFINPALILSFRYGFSISGKVLMPQLIYQAAPIISALIIAWAIFKETPSNGTLAGTFFAILSILSVVFWDKIFGK